MNTNKEPKRSAPVAFTDEQMAALRRCMIGGCEIGWLSNELSQTILETARQVNGNAEREAQKNCTCPSGDGSLRWPCPSHPPATDADKQDALVKLRKAIDDTVGYAIRYGDMKPMCDGYFMRRSDVMALIDTAIAAQIEKEMP